MSLVLISVYRGTQSTYVNLVSYLHLGVWPGGLDPIWGRTLHIRSKSAKLRTCADDSYTSCTCPLHVLKKMSGNEGTPKLSILNHFDRIFRYKPFILEHLYFWETSMLNRTDPSALKVLRHRCRSRPCRAPNCRRSSCLAARRVPSAGRNPASSWIFWFGLGESWGLIIWQRSQYAMTSRSFLRGHAPCTLDARGRIV